MTMPRWSLPLALLALVAQAACTDEAGPSAAPDGPATGGAGGAGKSSVSPFLSGAELRVDLPISGAARVRLAGPAVVAGEGAWDLSFEGQDIQTCSGPSGPGQGGGFGPLDAADFAGDAAPTVPFLTGDHTGGAFVGWYLYEGGTAHVLWSRFHVHGVREGDRLWKVQILSYYGEQDGAPIAARYRLRYAELTAAGAGPTRTLDLLDATAGGAAAPATSPGTCVDLGAGTLFPLTPAEAQVSSAWHLCFRRDSITVNGERGGPRGVGAVDLDAAASESEQLAEIKTRTDASQAARFDAVTRASFAGSSFRGDHIRSVFSDAWLDQGGPTPAPVEATWLVAGADGASRYLVAFTAFEPPSASAAGAVVLRVKPTH
jgi:hypothetical protein